jgi:hypothetical protein
VGRATFPEKKAADALATALDSRTFQPWAFVAALGEKGSQTQKEVFLLFIEVLKGMRRKGELGLNNNPTDDALEEMAIALLKAYDSTGHF